MIGSTRSLQHTIHCIIYTGLFIAIWIRTCNGMPVDISMERLSETFIPLESSESSEVRRILNFIAALRKNEKYYLLARFNCFTPVNHLKYHLSDNPIFMQI